MATQSPGFSIPLADLAATLLAEREVGPRARVLAAQVREFVPQAAVVVYVVADQEAPSWSAKATAGDIALETQEVEFEAGTLGALAEKQEPLLFAGSELAREDYAHLNVVRTVVTIGYMPLIVNEMLIGAIELVSYERPIGEDSLALVAQLDDVAAAALASGIIYESERNTQLESITRVTQLYDLEKVFNSTLEMDELLPIITSKFQEILGVQAVNLWLVEGESLLLVQQTGTDESVEVGQAQKAGEGIAADVSEAGEPLRIDNAEDERLQRRNAKVAEGQVFSLMAAPLVEKENEVGVVEVINKLDGTPFDEDDLFLLTNIAEAAAGALHNASLLQAERKVEILETLVEVSREITSTLNLERVLQAVVNGPQAVIPYERASIALEHNGKLHLKAVSGMPQIHAGDPAIKPLDEMLHWASGLQQEIFVTQHGDTIDEERPETREKFRRYFEETGVRSFYALPLADDQGRVGVLSLESSDPDFLAEAHLEMVKVLAGQATVAIRNATMYKEVPFIGIIEPILQKKHKFMALEKRRRTASLVLAAAVLVFLVVIPLPMRVDGDAVVAPAHTVQVQPEVDGVVKAVYVREGQPVTRGTVLAQLEDWEYRAALAAAQAQYETATSQMNRALAQNDGTEAGIQRLQADYWAAEVTRARERLERTRLKSPIDGVVATPHVENFVGRRLEHGDSFAEVIDSSHALVDVAIDEHDVALMNLGDAASVKLDAFATRTLSGEVVVVSPKSEARGEERVFFARVSVPNPDGTVRAGMQGRSKVKVGWRPSGYVLFRRLGMWIWSKLWSLAGW